MQESQSSLAKRLFKSSSVYAFSGILRNLVGFLMLPIYTRYLSPEDYGVVSLAIFFVSLMEIAFGARLGQATAKFFHDQQDEAKRKEVVASALFFTSLISLAVSTAVFFFSSSIASLVFGTATLAIIISIFSVLITTQAIETTGLDLIRIRNKVWWYFWFSLTKLIVQLSLNIILVVVLELGVMGVAIASALSSVLFAGVMFVVTVRDVGFTFSRTLAKAMFAFCVPLWFSGLVSLYIGSSNRYWMRIYSSLDDIGYFSLAERLASILAVLLWQPFYQYWSVERFRLKDRSDAIEIQNYVFVFISIALMIAGLALSLFADFVVWIVASENFRSAASAVPFLVLAYIFSNLSSFYNFSFENTSKTTVISKITNIVAILITVFNILLIPLYGFVGAAIAFMFASMGRFYISLYFSRKVYDLNLPVRNLSMSVLLASAGFCCVFLLRRDMGMISGSIVSLIGFIFLSGLIAVLMLKKDDFLRIKIFISNFYHKKKISSAKK